jgi:hypothetical protein
VSLSSHMPHFFFSLWFTPLTLLAGLASISIYFQRRAVVQPKGNPLYDSRNQVVPPRYDWRWVWITCAVIAASCLCAGTYVVGWLMNYCPHPPTLAYQPPQPPPSALHPMGPRGEQIEPAKSISFRGLKVEPGGAISINQHGGLTVGTVNNFGPPPLPPPTVGMCVEYPAVMAGQDYQTVVTFATQSKFPRPWFALFFDGPVISGSVQIVGGAYGYTSERATKLPHPERSFAFRTTTVNFAGTTWLPGEGVIKATILSKAPVRLKKVLSGGGNDPNTGFKVNLTYSCN